MPDAQPDEPSVRPDGPEPRVSDCREPISQADLVYHRPAEVPVSGHPIGNGRMGTMVWTEADCVRMQINRVDVFAVAKSHAALPQYGETDYCGACARVCLEVGGAAFADQTFLQRLSLYDAEATVEAGGVAVRCFVSAVSDVLAIEVTDGRPEPRPLRLTLGKWRPDRVVHGDHIACLDLRAEEGVLLLSQTFREGDYSCSSAVAASICAPGVAVDGADAASMTLAVPPRGESTLVLICSAAALQIDRDPIAEAMAALTAVHVESYEALRGPHARWWADFWSRSLVRIDTPDEVAQTAQRSRSLLLYLMAGSSRGTLPPKWNGSIFSVNGDARAWGSQYWVWTTEMPYFPLHAADCSDLADPFFGMYVAQLPDCRRAARQRWDCEGAYFGETMPFDGPVVLPEDTAAEFRHLLRGQEPAAELTPRAKQLGQCEGSLSVLCRGEDLAAGRYTWISHVCSSGAELAVHAWWRYRYTGDRRFLLTHAYPLLRDVAEFYRTLVDRGADGLYHLHGTNVHEDFWGVTDSIMDLAAIRGTVPPALAASELLGLDEGLREGWRDLPAHLAPYPLGADPEAKALTGGVLADDVWAAGHRGDVDGRHNPEDVWLNPVFPFEDWTGETHDPAVDAIVRHAIEPAPRHAAVLGGAGLNTAIRTPIAAVRAGRGEDLPALLGAYWNAFSPLPNGFSLFEGQDAHSIEHLGLLAMTLQEALLQSVSPHPAEPEVISVFPAWPKGWDAEFRLLGRGGFEVVSRHADGRVLFVEIHSRRGEPCRLRNPWRRRCRIEQATGASWEAEGDVVLWETAPGASYRVTPVG